MGAYKNKNKKKAKSVKEPKVGIRRNQYPEKEYYSKKPVWKFCNADTEYWCLDNKYTGNDFWNKILPILKNLERLNWSDILVNKKKLNHSINVNSLTKVAQKRLIELNIEAESLISIRIDGTHRIYGYIIDNAFNILWYDKNHGDNTTCVCTSHKKHT